MQVHNRPPCAWKGGCAAISVEMATGVPEAGRFRFKQLQQGRAGGVVSRGARYADASRHGGLPRREQRGKMPHGRGAIRSMARPVATKQGRT
jgi:hypothetical protein